MSEQTPLISDPNTSYEPFLKRPPVKTIEKYNKKKTKKGRSVIFFYKIPSEDELKELLDFCIRIKTQLDICDRKWKFKIYKKCFLGQDLITEISSMKDSPFLSGTSTIEERVNRSICVANELIRAGYIFHVKHEHWFMRDSIQKTLFFRFNEGLIEEDMKQRKPLSTRRMSFILPSGERDLVDSCSHSGSEHDENGCVGKTQTKPSLSDAQILYKQVADMNTKLSRLSEAFISSSEVINECQMKISILEDSISALVLAITIIALGDVWGLLAGELSSVAIVSTVLIFLLLLFREKRKSSQNSKTLSEKIDMMTHLFMEKDLSDYSDDNTDDSKRRNFTIKRSMSMRISTTLQRIGKKMSVKNLFQDPLILVRGKDDLPQIHDWPHRPCLLVNNISASPDLKVPEYGDGPITIGKPFRIESDLFEGTILIRIKNIESDNETGDASYFDSRSRIFQSIVQGRFKEELLVSNVFTGHEFCRPFKNLPPSFILNGVTKLCSTLAPGADIDIKSNTPKILALLGATSQTITADMPGQEPNIMNNDIKEDCSEFGGTFLCKLTNL